MQKITTFLWFNDNAEEAANFYVSVFKNGRIGRISRYGDAGQDVHGRPPGSVMTVEFALDGQQFVALNGGPVFTFNEAISLVINCESQDEIDYFWDKLTAGGGKPVQCGWLRDKFGLSWQVVPTALSKLMSGDPAAANRVMEAMLKMVKLDIKALEQAAAKAA